MPKKSKTTKPGPFRKSSSIPTPKEPKKAEIGVEGADHLYREIRIENTLEDEKGKKVGRKKGAHIEVVVEADEEDTTPKGSKPE